MQAVILAAGLGRRLGQLTSANTKCMVAVNGEPIINRLLRQLGRHDLKRIVIVTGYEGAKLRNHIDSLQTGLPIVYVDNPVYDKTNNIYSLWLTREMLAEDDTLLLESDLVLDDDVIDAAITSKDPDVALVAKYRTWMDGTMVTLDEEGYIVNFIPKRAFDFADTDSYYKTANIYRFSRNYLCNRYLPFLDAYIRVMGENEYYEQVLRVITLVDRQELKGLDISHMRWYEIDDIQDLRIAETIFATPEERLRKLQHSYGGYWRYPDIKDFCYLVNPYFPDRDMISEMQANFEPLLRQYPSGMGINSLLAGKYFGVSTENIVVGNGAAELIKALMENEEGKVGVVRPTFEEYPNRLDTQKVVEYRPKTADLRYTADDLIDHFKESGISTLLLVNPDNPSGNYICTTDLKRLVRAMGSRGIKVVVDESFVDFADAENASLLADEVLEEAGTNLVVVKSISKSYGVPGLRLGVIATADRKMIERLKKQVAIWNINSFAEFYMQIFGKYQNDYAKACRRIRQERNRMYDELCKTDGLEVFPSQANYFLCHITAPMTAHELTLHLLEHYDLLIKDCSGKAGFDGEGYVRLAVRDRADNDELLAALRTTLSK